MNQAPEIVRHEDGTLSVSAWIVPPADSDQVEIRDLLIHDYRILTDSEIVSIEPEDEEIEADVSGAVFVKFRVTVR